MKVLLFVGMLVPALAGPVGYGQNPGYKDKSYHSPGYGDKDYKDSYNPKGDDYGQQSGYSKGESSYKDEYRQVYRGKYPGSCGKDGFYYNDDYSFMICANGNGYEQRCAPGSRNSGYEKYAHADTIYFHDFCDVNLVDEGYNIPQGHSAGYAQPYPYSKDAGYGAPRKDYGDGYYGNRDGGYGYGYQGDGYKYGYGPDYNGYRLDKKPFGPAH